MISDLHLGTIINVFVMKDADQKPRISIEPNDFPMAEVVLFAQGDGAFYLGWNHEELKGWSVRQYGIPNRYSKHHSWQYLNYGWSVSKYLPYRMRIKKIINIDLKCSGCNKPAPHAIRTDNIYLCSFCKIIKELNV